MDKPKKEDELSRIVESLNDEGRMMYLTNGPFNKSIKALAGGQPPQEVIQLLCLAINNQNSLIESLVKLYGIPKPVIKKDN